MNENTPGLPSPLHLDSETRQKLCMVGSQPVGREKPNSLGFAEATNRRDELREIAANLERLCIEYACQHRVNGTGIDTRNAWMEFKAELERLKGVA
jgi:hypothetical protein